MTELIPAGTVAQHIVNLKRGGEVLTEYSQEPMFKTNGRTKWIECEFTVCMVNLKDVSFGKILCSMVK